MQIVVDAPRAGTCEQVGEPVRASDGEVARLRPGACRVVLVEAGRLTEAVVEAAGWGRYPDGGGLWLVVERFGRRRWEVLSEPNRAAGRLAMAKGLGAYPAVGLEEARRLAAGHQRLSSGRGRRRRGAATGHRLVDERLRRLVRRGRYYDGRGLFLRVLSGTRRYWIQRLSWDGCAYERMLGSFPEVSLGQARAAARENYDRFRSAVDRGRQPSAALIARVPLAVSDGE